MRRPSVLVLSFVLLLASVAPTFADVTAFIGTATAPTNRQTRGFAIGIGLLIIGFEFEYANINEDLEEGSPAVRTGTTNVLLQTPFPVGGMQFYVTTGGGVYREKLGDVLQETHVGVNTGGGVKVTLLGPIRARLDYRVFKLRGAPLYATVHRVYAGLNLAF